MNSCEKGSYILGQYHWNVMRMDLRVVDSNKATCSINWYFMASIFILEGTYISFFILLIYIEETLLGKK